MKQPNILYIMVAQLAGSGLCDHGICQFSTRMEIPLFTTLTAAQAAVNEIRSLGKKELKVRSLQEHYVVGAAGKVG